MTRIIAILLSVASIGVTSCNPALAGPRAAKKAAAVPLAIPVAIASISLLEAAVYCAAAAGLITVVQSESFQRELSQTRRAIQNMSAEAWAKARDGVAALIQRIEHSLERSGWDMKTRSCSRPTQVSPAIPLSVPITRVHTEYCGNPAECCKDLGNKFAKDFASYDRNKNTMKRIYRGYEGKGKLPKKMDCCLEWDGQHHGWEIFDDKGRHMGERSCQDFSNDNPCQGSDPMKFGKHVSPNSTTHRPRSCF
ncbi:MAG: hypothetical protein JNL01_00035 [Bdellovibrionales bacterium]|nr:hypothetical protein [Bdellovibrionales bacterium]